MTALTQPRASVIVRGSIDEAARVGAALIAALVRERPDAVLGLATGSSPLPLYRALRGVDLARARGFALDEYAGIDHAHPESYHSVIRRDVVEPLGMDPGRVRVPDSAGADAYDDAIAAAGGVDLQILGIGANGHIGFNEPGSGLDTRTRVVALTERTRQDNRRFFGGDVDLVPTHAVTQGLATILSARSILLIAAGRAKADAVAAAIEGPVTSECPASSLQRHPAVTYLLDAEAASGLRGA